MPTIFYTQKESELAELVDVFVRHNSPSPGGQAVLTLGKAKYTATLASGWDFGEQRVEFAVPEFPAGHARAKWPSAWAATRGASP